MIPIIYKINPLTFKPRKGFGCIYLYKVKDMEYVGQTYRDLLTRHKQHISKTNSFEFRCIVDQVLTTHDHSLKILYTCLKSELNKFEKYFINLKNTFYPNGWNMTTGGDSKRELSEDSVKRGVQKRWNNRANNKQFRKVDQYDMNGNFIKTFDSIKEIGYYGGAIQMACIGKYKSSHGYIWRYHGEPLGILPKRIGRKRKVDMYDLNGKLIKTFDSASDTGHYRKTIADACKGKYKQLYGYIWRFHGEPLGNIDFGKKPQDKFIKKPKYELSCAKKIDQYTVGGTFIQTFRSADQTGYDPSSIHKCCKGLAKTVGGYQWRYHIE